MANDNEPQKNVEHTKISVKAKKSAAASIPVQIVLTKRRKMAEINAYMQDFSPREVFHILRTYRAGRKATKAQRHLTKLLGT